MSQADQDIAMEASLQTTGLGSAAVKDDGVVPIINLQSATAAEELWKAASEVGFFSVINHGISQSLIDDAFASSAGFFQQTLKEKMNQAPFDAAHNVGFEYFKQVRPSTGMADQKESFQVTARQGVMDGRWPSPSFRSTAEQLTEAAHTLAGNILTLLEPHAVPRNEPGTMASSHSLWSEEGQCTLRFLHYPPMPKTITEKLLAEGYWRAGPHTDWSNLTLLFTSQSGLECCANPRTGNLNEMYWTKVTPAEGAVAINIGDMLARWSDGKLYSNLHRVRLPEDASKPRYSIAFFAQSDKGTLLKSQNNPPITAGDYILSRLKSNFSKKEVSEVDEKNG